MRILEISPETAAATVKTKESMGNVATRTPMLTVYPAGPISNDVATVMLHNIAVGMDMTRTLIDRGFAPYPVFCDYSLGLIRPDCLPLSVLNLQNVSMEWLRRSDAILMLPEWETSKGAVAEHDQAKAMGKPTFYTLEALEEWRYRKMTEPQSQPCQNNVVLDQHARLCREASIQVDPWLEVFCWSTRGTQEHDDAQT